MKMRLRFNRITNKGFNFNWKIAGRCTQGASDINSCFDISGEVQSREASQPEWVNPLNGFLLIVGCVSALSYKYYRKVEPFYIGVLAKIVFIFQNIDFNFSCECN